MKTVRTDSLEIAYSQFGPADGWAVVLSHCFPYDVDAYEEIAARLAAAGARVTVPYLRGFGPTRFLSPETMRSGQQAALGKDVIGLLDALGVEKAILAGFDWGGLASCVAKALWPERVDGLVSTDSYDIIDVERLRHAFPPSLENAAWYQHVFQTERGRECLTGTVVNSAACYVINGRLIGNLMTRSLSERPQRSIIQILLLWSYTHIAFALD